VRRSSDLGDRCAGLGLRKDRDQGVAFAPPPLLSFPAASLHNGSPTARARSEETVWPAATGWDARWKPRPEGKGDALGDEDDMLGLRTVGRLIDAKHGPAGGEVQDSPEAGLPAYVVPTVYGPGVEAEPLLPRSRGRRRTMKTRTARSSTTGPEPGGPP